MNMKSFVSTLVLCTILCGLGEAQISGPPGPSGDPGPSGSPGSPGDQGPPGDPGVAGDSGEPGARGISGPPGLQGEPGRKGFQGENGPTGFPGTDGIDGRPGIPGPTGAQGQRGRKGSRGGVGGLIGVGPIGRPGGPGLRGPRGSKGNRGNQGASYIHWGGGFCPNSTLLLYSGYGFSSGNDLLCFTSNAEYYEEDGLSPKGVSEVVTITNISCAVCYAADKATVFTLPGSPVCPDGWNQEYSGYVVSGPFEGSQHVCIDQTPETLMNIQRRAILPITVINSGLHPTYEAGRLLTCSVCSS